MAVFQQVILDKINATPSDPIEKSHANLGRLVLRVSDADSQEANRNKEALGAPLIIWPTATQFLALGAFGILGDWHHSKLCSVFRKGRVIVDTNRVPEDSHIGMQIFPVDAAEGKVQPINSDGFGEILDYGTHSEIGYYYYVDINLP